MRHQFFGDEQLKSRIGSIILKKTKVSLSEKRKYKLIAAMNSATNVIHLGPGGRITSCLIPLVVQFLH